MPRRFPLWLMICSTLSGCMVGPDYQLPSLDTPADWHEAKPKDCPSKMEQSSYAHSMSFGGHSYAQDAVPAGCATRSPQGVGWWQDFDDPVLNDLVERALKNNENLQVAAARIAEVRGLRESANAALFPHVDAAAGSQRGNPGVTTLGGNVSVHQAAFDAAWEIDLFGGTRRQVEAQDALIGAREAAYRNAALSLSAEVAREYVTLRQFQAQMTITRQTAQTQHGLYDIVQDRYKGGLVSTLDVAQAETLYKTTLAKLPDFEQQIKTSSYRLSVLLGENPGNLDKLAADSAPIPVANRLPVLDAPAGIIRSRPDVAEAERNLAAATASQGVAISALYPKVSLSSMFGIQHAAWPVGHYLSTKDIWNIGGNVSMPILEFGSIEGQINAANARQVQALHQYRQTVLAALGDVETDLSNLTEESRRHKLLHDAGSSADHAVNVAKDRYGNGLVDFTTVLQAEQQRFGVQLDLAASQSAIAQDIIALHKALGENPAPSQQQ